jgi:hypothetical protein
MSDVLVEVANISFDTVTVEKASSGQAIAAIAKGSSKTFKLLDDSGVKLSAASAAAATVTLEGVEDSNQIHVDPDEEVLDLFRDQPVTIKPDRPTKLSLQSTDSGIQGVKCGEVIIQPPAPS